MGCGPSMKMLQFENFLEYTSLRSGRRLDLDCQNRKICVKYWCIFKKCETLYQDGCIAAQITNKNRYL